MMRLMKSLMMLTVIIQSQLMSEFAQISKTGLQLRVRLAVLIYKTHFSRANRHLMTDPYESSQLSERTAMANFLPN